MEMDFIFWQKDTFQFFLWFSLKDETWCCMLNDKFCGMCWNVSKYNEGSLKKFFEKFVCLCVCV